MICPKCGAKLEEGTRVCPICGKSLVATSVGTVFKRRDLQEYDELSSDEYDDSDYQDDEYDNGSYEEEQYDEYDDGSYEEEQYDDGYEAESGPYDNENNEAYFSDQSDEKPVKKKSIANKILGGMILICLAGIVVVGIATAKMLTATKQDKKKLPQTTRGLMRPDHYFVPAGQSTQMVIGASDESDYQIISVSEALYQKFEMKRIFYSAFINVNHDSSLPDLPGPPLLREHRLYQADFLLRFYGFRADELLSEKNPNFNEQIDPKCNWAVHHLELFPVEINRADYYTLLRVPGIGTKSARRIMAARRYAKLDFSDLKKIGVVLKRAVYFITCKGKMMYHTRMEEGYITRNLMYQERPMQMLLSDGTVQTYEQLSLFDDRGKIVV